MHKFLQADQDVSSSRSELLHVLHIYALLTKIQYHSFMGWPSRRFAVFFLVVERDDSRKHHVYCLSFQHEVRELSLWLGLWFDTPTRMAWFAGFGRRRHYYGKAAAPKNQKSA